MSEDDKKIKRKQVLSELRSEEETENQLIWLYQTLIDLGIENCFSEDHRAFFSDGMKTLRDESKAHKILINSVIAKYGF
ncbi:hypothetical protein CVU82_00920 [Candidatus Falkowbacteria bacterium HGW-Falkowbacteria-1]|uniref:Uncharacterized protein n=1 Tax=Candidatus Falkowbacteria bacterium HGW-Falkowbacteria-1 TaxID=2013768 RepID=A0A2N2EAJ2_9BACT|nr:MAG: hypothetical protein CVU82_00920 [Candidatus Falkowbacteria bacterium HGW-Falkowbacteria-1]